MDDPSAGPFDVGGSPQGSGAEEGAGNFFFNPIAELCNILVCLCCCVCVCFLLIIVFILSLFGLITFAVPKPVDTVFEKWAVVCDAPLCADVAKEIFAKNGAIGDAAVAVLLCMGVTAPHLTGTGGGLMALLYDRSTKKVQALDALGVSPKNLTADMFSANPSALKLGASASIVPGAVAGYQALHSKVGKLNWKDLFQPAIRLAKEGFAIGAHLAAALANNEKVINVSAALRKRFSNPATGSLLRKGDKLVQPELAGLLGKLAEGKADYFYKNELADEIEEAILAEGGVLNKADLSEYQPVWQDPVTGKMGDEKRIHSAPIPGAGAIVAAAVHKIRVQNPSIEEREVKLPTMSHARIHHFVEALKFSLAKRPELGDVRDVKEKEIGVVAEIIGYAVQKYDKKKPLSSAAEYGIKYAPDEDLGGAHMTIVGPRGDALSITSGLNGMFGSGFMTSSGLLLNNYMDAFAKPGKQFELDPSPANQIGPAKRPMTSMVPSIITTSNTPSDLVGAFGSSGGLPGISALAQLITCTRKYSLPPCVWNDSLVQPTFRSTVPNTVFTEQKTKEFDPASMLLRLGNSVTKKPILASATGIIATRSGSWLAPNDTRRIDGSHAGE